MRMLARWQCRAAQRIQQLNRIRLPHLIHRQPCEHFASESNLNLASLSNFVHAWSELSLDLEVRYIQIVDDLAEP
jgi:hypothetical protein